MKAESESGRFNGFIVVTVTEALLLGSIPVVESVTSCVRRSHDDMLKEERVTVLSPDG